MIASDKIVMVDSHLDIKKKFLSPVQSIPTTTKKIVFTSII